MKKVFSYLAVSLILLPVYAASAATVSTYTTTTLNPLPKPELNIDPLPRPVAIPAIPTTPNAAATTTTTITTTPTPATTATVSSASTNNTPQNTVQVVYQNPGRVLGIFPVTMNVKANVDAQGNVTLNYPWYHFMTMSSAQADLSASIKSKLDDDAWFQNYKKGTSGTLNAAAEAHITADIQAGVKAALATSTFSTNVTSTGY